MAYLVTTASGNFTAAGTWAICDTPSVNDSTNSTGTVTTSFVTSTTWTNSGATVVDALLVRVNSVAASPSGTFTVALDQGGVTVVGSGVTVNVADLPATAANVHETGWVCFKLGGSVTLTNGVVYGLKVTTSVTSMVTLDTSTANNWSRLLRTTTTQAPTGADTLVVVGELTGAGTKNTRSVTMDNTSTTAIGTAAGASQALNIGNSATLAYGTAASTAYYLRLGIGTAAGGVIIYNGGTLSITGLPGTSTAVLEFNVTAGQVDALSTLDVRNGGTLTVTGTAVTPWTTLTSDAAINAAGFAVAAATGWVTGNTAVLASTSRTATDVEAVTIGTQSGTGPFTIPVLVGGGTGGTTLAHAHGGGGTALVIAEVGLLNRQIAIRSNQTTLASTGGAQILIEIGAIVAVQYAELSYLSSASTVAGAIHILTQTGSCSFDSCSFHDMRNSGIYFNTPVGTPSVTNCVFYNVNTTQGVSSYVFYDIATTNASASVLSNNLFIGVQSGSGSYCVNLRNLNITFSNNVITSSGFSATSFAVHLDASFNNRIGGTLTGNITHSNAGYGVGCNNTGTLVATLDTWLIWRNAGGGVQLNVSPDKFVLKSCTLFGNVTQNIGLNTSIALLILISCTSRSDASFATFSGVSGLAGFSLVYIFSSTFGAGVAHGSGDISLGTGMQVVAWGSTFNSSSGNPALGSLASSVMRSQHDGGVSTAYKTWSFRGTCVASTTQVHGAQTFSWKCVANNVAVIDHPLIFPGPTSFDTLKVAVSANPGTGVSLTVWVFPQTINSTFGTGLVTLHVVGGMVAGVGSPGVDPTPASTGVTGSWQALTISNLIPTEVGVLEYYITMEGNGTTVYIGDVAVTES